jgi:hypothetical protein
MYPGTLKLVVLVLVVSSCVADKQASRLLALEEAMKESNEKIAALEIEYAVPTIGDIFGATGVLLGLQLAAIGMRLQHEIDRQQKTNEVFWLNMADMINIGGVMCNVLVFISPILVNSGGGHFLSKGFFGVGLLLTAAFPVTLMGHYDMLPTRKTHSKLQSYSQTNHSPGDNHFWMRHCSS